MNLIPLYFCKFQPCHIQVVGFDPPSMAPQVPTDPLVFMLAPYSMTKAEYDLWGPGIPFTKWVMVEIEYDEFSGTRLMPSLIATVCVLASLTPLQSVIICILCTLVTFKQNTCVRLALLLVLSLTLSVCPSRSIPMALMALLGSLPLGTIQTSQATLFLVAHGQWVFFHSYSLFFLFLHPNTCSNNLSFKIQPIVQEHEDLVWLAGNLKLELTNYSWQLYGGKDMSDDDDDDDVGGEGGGGLALTLSHQSRKRHFRWPYKQTDRHSIA